MTEKISLTTSCYNEEDVIQLFIDTCEQVVSELDVDYELIICDNASTDRTREILRENAKRNPCIKLIFNEGNYGPHRSPVNGFFAASGDAVIMLASDLQDPPELIKDFVREWRAGHRVVMGTYETLDEDNLFWRTGRKLFYFVLQMLAETPIIKNATGFGIYDRQAVDAIKDCYDPRPFPRGLVSELGFQIKLVNFKKPERAGGQSKRSFSEYYSTFVLSITSHSILPLRFIGLIGYVASFFSFMVAVVYTIRKLLYWDSFDLGIAPAVILAALMFSLLFVFLGILAEYVASIHHHVRKRPLVIERERINFEE